MLKIHGPTYRYQGERLRSPEMIFVEDHHYSEDDLCHHLRRLLDASPCKDHTIVFDHVVQQDEFLDYQCVYYPRLLAREATEFSGITTNWANKTYAFNFMINKIRPHRLLLLNLINELNLTNYIHSLCWQSSPVKSIPTTDYRLGNEVVLEHSFRNGSYSNALVYKKLLQEQIFETSCVSLITEPAYYERETIVTEKTLMAIYGGTVPIWVGGWKIPDYMRNLGFDVFDDIVDHSYQACSDPTERCRLAVINNIQLLQRPVVVDPARLQHNLDLVKSNPWLKQVNSLKEIYPDLRTI